MPLPRIVRQLVYRNVANTTRSPVTSPFRKFIIGCVAAVLAAGQPARAQDTARDATGPESQAPALRITRLQLASGAELVSILGRTPSGDDLPLVAVLNDTLGDQDTANDRLRYVWVFSYCAPSVKQRIFATIPFFYRGGGSRAVNNTDPPPVIFDFSKNPNTLWRRIAWYTTQAAILDPGGWALMAGSRTYRRNISEYRDAHLMNGLALLSSVQATGTDATDLFPDAYVEEAYGRIVAQGLAGAFMNDSQFGRAYERQTGASRRTIAHNWELLRQRAEEEGLFFQPIPEPPAIARHAIVWVSRDEVAKSPRSRRFDDRFLNIASPWSDASLRTWAGYSRTFYVEPDGRITAEPSSETSPVEMIPLAVYGLDFPKIPAILVDFRTFLNPKTREISGRAVDDVSRFLLDVTPFGDLKYLVARKMFGFVVGRRGVDITQPSRAAVAVQLSALLNLENELDPELRAIIARDLQKLRVNPLVNGVDAEERAARAQFQALLLQVESGELDRRIEQDRAKEKARLAHGGFVNTLFSIAHYLSFGAYTRREDSEALRDKYATARALEHHEKLLMEVASAPRPVEVSWDPSRFTPSLEFVASNKIDGSEQLVAALEAIARNSDTTSTQILAVDALASTTGKRAQTVLARLQLDPGVSVAVRARSTDILNPDRRPLQVTGAGGARGGRGTSDH